MMLEPIFNLLLEKCLGISLLITVLLLVRPSMLKYSSARLAYQSWLVIPVYLLLPNASIWSNSAFGQMIFYSSNTIQATQIAVTNSLAETDFLNAIVAIWLIGVLFLSIKYCIGYLRLKNSLQPYQPLANIAHNLPIKTKFQLAHSKLIEFPAVFGFYTATIILPKSFSDYPQQHQQIILNHELYHIKRRDYQINQIRHLIRILFWFNPLVHLAEKAFEADQEMSCDLGVLDQKEVSQKDYANSLLLESYNQPRNILLSQWNYPHLIKERIKMIGNNKTQFWHKYLAGLFMILGLSYTSLVFAHDKYSKQEVEPVSIENPKYPKQAAMDGIEGEVRLGFDLTSDGTPRNIKVLHSKPEGVFEQAALESFSHWRFDKNLGEKQYLSYTMKFAIR